ncbi:Similar to Usp36: Ubiquitin carboxyl-terminal hydrolase 36 (Drosophila ananassae) [Cotesia congregata]|uniref:Ubiquitin carboxyl-terminal hydrolase n=1 Tax=Cotesia congregata TaxID=51543 RepID=A0A8J2HCL0_COTCN|nr:Similar to Usp36: Ubiquitin carboxyl-terminal hydrolase 36 (Drosophila ananassae) [Cotesia congregata]
MPAVSVCDPVAAALRHSLEVGQSKSSTEDITISLTSGASRILQSEVQYEETDGYKSIVLDQLKAKYIVLSLPNSNLNNHQSDNNTGSNTARKKNEQINKMTRPSLPEPKITLYQPEKVTLGWDKSFPVGSGLINVGNTCYLNSTLQALFHVPALVNWLLTDSHHNSKCEQNAGGGECLTCAMAKTLQFSHEKSGNAIKPFYIYNKLKCKLFILICRTMVPGQQEDAHEFLRYLLEGMERAYLQRHKATKLDSYSKETTPINQIFGGYIRTEVKCLKCQHVSTTFQHFQDLLVDIRKANTLDEALSSYFSREELDNNDYKCEACKKRVPATKQFSLEQPPKVLCVQLKRFSVLGNKISRHIGFKQTVNMGPYLWREPGEPPRKLNYKLMSIITHMGPSVGCGHYTAVAQVSSGQYYSFDDSCVRSINISNVFNTNAYIMIFEMESPAINNQLPQNVKSNGLSNLATFSNSCSLKSSSPKPSTSGLAASANGVIKSNGSCNKIIRDSDSSPSPSSSFSSAIIGPQLPPSKLLEQKTTQQKNSNFIGPLLPKISAEKTQPRLVMQIKNGKVANGNNGNSLVPYDGSSDEEDNSKNNNCNPNTSTKSSTSVSNGVTKSDNKIPTATKTDFKTLKSVNTIAQKSLPIPSLTSNGSASNNNSLNNNSNGNNNTNNNNNNNNNNSNNSAGQRYQNGKIENNNGKLSETNGKDKCHQPIRIKVNSNLEDKIPTKAASSISGWEVSKDAPSPTSGATPNGCAAAPRNFNGTNRSDTVSHLYKMSHRGYGSSSVTTWNGSRTQMDREVDNERREERKRHFNADDEEMDRGRTKKVKCHREYESRSNPGYNPFQEYHNGKSWNRSNGGGNYRRYYNNNNNNNNNNSNNNNNNNNSSYNRQGHGNYRHRYHNNHRDHYHRR